MRDIAGDAASKAAGKVNPSDEQLSQIDAPAADNTWHEKPEISRDGIKGQFNDAVNTGKKHAQDVAGDASQGADPHGTRDPQDMANRDPNAVDPNQGASAGLESAKAKASEVIPDDQKDRAREYRDRTNKYFKNKFPKERRDQIVYRLKKMIVEIQGHEDCECSVHP